MKTARIETFAWVAIYAGLALIALGLSLRHQGGVDLGTGVALVGGLGVAAGAVLVWVRSRLPGADGA